MSFCFQLLTDCSETFLLTTLDLFEELSNIYLELSASLVVVYFILLHKEFYCYYVFIFFLTRLFVQYCLSTLSNWSFKIFSLYPRYMNFSLSIPQCFLSLVRVEQIIFCYSMLGLLGILYLKDFGWY